MTAGGDIRLRTSYLKMESGIKILTIHLTFSNIYWQQATDNGSRNQDQVKVHLKLNLNSRALN